MLAKLIALLGKSIESDEIRALFEEWKTDFPKKTFCTADNPGLGSCKMEREGIKLYFSRGANSRYLKPVKGWRKSSYIAMLTHIEFQKKRKGEVPFGIKHEMTDEELTAILGKSVTTNLLGETIMWRKTYQKIYEIIVADTVLATGKKVRTVTLNFLYEPNLFTLEDYEKAGL